MTALGYWCVSACPDNCYKCEPNEGCTFCDEGYLANMDTGQCEVGVLIHR